MFSKGVYLKFKHFCVVRAATVMQDTIAAARAGVIKTEGSSRFMTVESGLSPPPVEVILTTSQNISESPQSVVATRTRDGKLSSVE